MKGEVLLQFNLIVDDDIEDVKSVKLRNPSLDDVRTVVKGWAREFVLQHVDDTGRVALNTEEEWQRCLQQGDDQDGEDRSERGVELRVEVLSLRDRKGGRCGRIQRIMYGGDEAEGTPSKCNGCDFAATGVCPGFCCRACQTSNGSHGVFCQRRLYDIVTDTAGPSAANFERSPSRWPAWSLGFCCATCAGEPGTHAAWCTPAGDSAAPPPGDAPKCNGCDKPAAPPPNACHLPSPPCYSVSGTPSSSPTDNPPDPSANPYGALNWWAAYGLFTFTRQAKGANRRAVYHQLAAEAAAAAPVDPGEGAHAAPGDGGALGAAGHSGKGHKGEHAWGPWGPPQGWGKGWGHAKGASAASEDWHALYPSVWTPDDSYPYEWKGRKGWPSAGWKATAEWAEPAPDVAPTAEQPPAEKS
ncbi:hypothetical protein DIPPA_10502 [Diplonema papillatum]|nr:hypothetical protein DIPPA_10502 [Diplonema papillatum]|eukprot:gene3969-6148_t